MSALAWAALALAATLILAATGDLISEEIRGWLDLAPRAILRLAAAQLDPAQRETIYHDEWLPELCYALRGAEARPITRLILGTTYATGLLISARRIARRVNRTPQASIVSTAIVSTAIVSTAIVSTASAPGYAALVNQTGHAIWIGRLRLTLNNGNTLMLGNLPEDARRQVIREFEQGSIP